MNLALAALEARRTATLVALGGTLAVTWLALLKTAGALDEDGVFQHLGAVESRVDMSRIPAAWTAGLVIALGWCVLRSANLAQSWFGSRAGGESIGEGSWLAPTVPSRFGIAAAAQAGICAAGATLALCMALAIAIAAPVDDSSPLLEPFAVAGPMRSHLLLPGDRYEQSFGEIRPPAGATVRVRLTPAAGAGAGTTQVEIAAGEHIARRPLVRKSWVELDLSADVSAVATRNVGDGAAALLGPRPVEIWQPSSALLRGHLRLWLHACALLVFLVGASLSAGLWMSPGISAAMALSIWLFLAATGFGPAWVPGTTDMSAALAALGDGRAPAIPSVWTWTVSAAAAVLAATMAMPALRSWHHEGRG